MSPVCELRGRGAFIAKLRALYGADVKINEWETRETEGGPQSALTEFFPQCVKYLTRLKLARI